jgi:8-oxo-dGTP pyrophosphatase MutT (NUDIX family)
MHRRDLLDHLERYLARRPEDRVRVDHVRQFVRNHPDCFERTCVEGHITGSAWVASRDGRRVVLVHHAKLDKWLQPGGHADGEREIHEVAFREAREETGLTRLELAAPEPIDIDVHPIPARGDEPAHLHHDLRYLVYADPDEEPRVSDESHDVRWFDLEEALALNGEEGLRRLARRAVKSGPCGSIPR